MATATVRIIQACFVNGGIVATARARSAIRARPLQAHGSEVMALDTSRLNLSNSVGRRLPQQVQEKMEAFFGADFSDVRIHQGPQAQSIGAHAFTMGSAIYFAPGQYAPDTARGQQLLGHELAHVIQQRTGRVRSPAGRGTVVVNDHALEAEADRMGARAAAFRPPIQARRCVGARADPRDAAAALQAKAASHRLVVGGYLHRGAGAPPDLAGHAFVSLEGPTGRRQTWGFSPANYSRYDPRKDIAKLRAGVPGVLHRDDDAFSQPGVKTRSYTLSPAQAKAALAKID